MIHKTDAVINISYCAAHVKGFDPADGNRYGHVHGETHARWLLAAVGVYERLGYPVLVSMTGWPGMIRVEVSPDNLERDVMWQVWKKARLLGVPDNAHHQSGAAWCLRQGLEAAAHMGAQYILHTAEDVLPDRGACEEMLARVREGYDYAGEAWGYSGEYLCSQFFACRVQTLVPHLDPGTITGENHLEKAFVRYFGNSRVYRSQHNYRHTHSPEEYFGWMKEEKA